MVELAACVIISVSVSMLVGHHVHSVRSSQHVGV